MSEPLIWIVGANGMLGSHLRAALMRQFPLTQPWQPTPARFSWTDPTRLAEELSHAVTNFAAIARARNGPWAVLWTAGIGVVNSQVAALEPELGAWAQLLELLGDRLIRPDRNLKGVIFLASSAGGVYGGNRADVITEHTPPHPDSAYGAHKLLMEGAARDFVDTFPSVSCLIGRISTLYGPGQDFRKRQGIISHISRCLIHRQQVTIYVPLETRRDYLFVDDCADQIVAGLSRQMTAGSGATIKIFASERPTSLAQIVGIFSRIAKHRPLIVIRKADDAQPISLKFRSDIWADLGRLCKTDLAIGIHTVHGHQLSLFQRGRLPPPSQQVHR